MNENEIYEILESYRQALDFLVEKVDGIVQENAAMKEQLGGLEHVLYDGILSPAKEAIDNAESLNKALPPYSHFLIVQLV